MSFLGEIKRRKVFQVAAVYVVVAWLLIQVVDVVGAPLNLPSWIDAVVIVLLAVGFPIAVILAWAFDLTPQGVKPDSGDQASGVPVQVGGQRLNHLLQALVLVAVGFLVVDQYVLEPSTSTVPTIAATLSTPAVDAFTRAVRRYDINLGPTEFLPSSLLSTEIAISPDARRLVYRAEVEDSSQLYLRELDQVTAQAIPGTEGGSKPFFSPDGESIGFIRNNRLHRVSVRGGPVQTLTDDDVQWRTGAFWTTDDTILFTVNADVGPDRLHRIPAVGGAAEPLGGEPDGSVQRNGWPYVLPDGNRVLFTIHFENLSASDGRVAVLSLETGEAQVIIEHAYNARYAKTGHIVFMRSAALWAVPFDLESLETTGDAVPIVSGIQTDTGRGASVYAFSDDGLLVYLSGVDTFGSARNMHLVWVSRDGEEEPVDATPGTYLSPRISPDGRRLAYTLVDSNGSEDIWVYDLARSVPTRLTFDATADIRPTWTPDGQRIVYWSDREDPGFFIRTADGTGQPERLTAAESMQAPGSFSPDGQQFLFSVTRGDGAADAYALSMDTDEPPRLLLPSTGFAIENLAVSPDGLWLAYTSDESGGGEEIFLRPFPNVEDDRLQVSRGGGEEPIWRPDSREIFYRNGGTLFAVSLDTDGSAISLGRPEVLFTGSYSSADINTYHISPDGQRFLMLKSDLVEGLTEQTTLTVVENWFEDLNRLAPRTE